MKTDREVMQMALHTLETVCGDYQGLSVEATMRALHEVLARPERRVFIEPPWSDEPPRWCTPEQEEIWEMGYDCAMSSCRSANSDPQPAEREPVAQSQDALDAARFRSLVNTLRWDGNAYLLPDMVVKEREWGQAYCSNPTLDELRSTIDAALASQAKGVSSYD